MEEESYYKGYDKFIEGLQILNKYFDKPKEEYFSAEHDVIYFGPDPSIVSPEDITKLEDYGFNVDKSLDCFYYYT